VVESCDRVELFTKISCCLITEVHVSEEVEAAGLRTDPGLLESDINLYVEVS
jgi:hypothetical protein